MALTDRPCAAKPAKPKPAAKIAAVIRCSDTEPSIAAGPPMPGSGPPGITVRSGLACTAHSAKTTKTKAAAKAIAPVAAGANHATNNAAATRMAKTMRAASA